MSVEQLTVISNFLLVIVTLIATHDTIRHDREFMVNVLKLVLRPKANPVTPKHKVEL